MSTNVRSVSVLILLTPARRTSSDKTDTSANHQTQHWQAKTPWMKEQVGPQNVHRMTARNIVLMLARSWSMTPTEIRGAHVHVHALILPSWTTSTRSLKKKLARTPEELPSFVNPESLADPRLVEQATEWQIPIFVMDCDVAAAFDNVSHYVIVNAMYGGHESPSGVGCSVAQRIPGIGHVHQAGRIMTPGMGRTCSVPQGDPCCGRSFWCCLGHPGGSFLRDVSIW